MKLKYVGVQSTVSGKGVIFATANIFISIPFYFIDYYTKITYQVSF